MTSSCCVRRARRTQSSAAGCVAVRIARPPAPPPLDRRAHRRAPLCTRQTIHLAVPSSTVPPTPAAAAAGRPVALVTQDGGSGSGSRARPAATAAVPVCLVRLDGDTGTERDGVHVCLAVDLSALQRITATATGVALVWPHVTWHLSPAAHGPQGAALPAYAPVHAHTVVHVH
jgi:hypothetical protein